MSELLAAWMQGTLLGLGVAAPLGPINIEIIRRHFASGWSAGLGFGLGACSVDTAYILVIMFGLVTVRPSEAVQAWLGLPGAVVLGVLAVLILRGARRSAEAAEQARRGERVAAGPAWRHYATGVALTLSSPLNVFFWLGAIAAGQTAVAGGPARWMLVAGVVCGTGGWVLGLNTALLALGRLIRRRAIIAINVSGAVILAGFAAISLWRLATFIMAE